MWMEEMKDERREEERQRKVEIKREKWEKRKR